jgi:outer membrane protein
MTRRLRRASIRSPRHRRGWEILRAAGALGLAAGLLAACRTPPFGELDPQAFVSSSADRPWVPSTAASDSIGVDSVEQGWPWPTRAGLMPGGPASLLRLVEVALENQPSTRRAWAQAQVKAAELGVSRGAWWPTLGVEADFYYERAVYPATGDAFIVTQAAFSPQLTLNYLLLDFGRREAADDAARAALWAANLQFNRTLQRTIRDVQVGYFKLDAAIALRETARRNVELAETVVAMVEQRFAMGLATQPALLQARQDLAQARFNLEATTAGIRTAQAALLSACGLAATTPIEIEAIREEALPAALEYRVEEVIDRALLGRPDLAAAVANVRQAEASVRSAEAAFLPTVGFSGSVGGIFTTFDTDVTQGPDYPAFNGIQPLWNVGLSGQWMLFEGYQRHNLVRAARATREAAEAELRAARLAAIGETWDAYFSLQAAVRQYEFGLALVRASEEAFEAVAAAYERGLATITELVTAERNLQQARSTLVSTRAGLLISAAELAFAAGAEEGRYRQGPAEAPRSASAAVPPGGAAP